MASSVSTLFLQLILIFSLVQFSLSTRKLTELVQERPLIKYHNGPLLSGKISINLIWYGNFKPTQRAIVTDFLTSLYSFKTHNQPSVATWWNTIEKYYRLTTTSKTQKPSSSFVLKMGKQILDKNCSLGKYLTSKQIQRLAKKGEQMDGINIVLTASDVAVEGFCSSTCGTHGSWGAKTKKIVYIWVGNSVTQCPGQCSWPFHQPIYGPQSPALVPPNNDVGLDGMVVNLASLMAGTVTNPFRDGFYQGSADAPLEAASACPGVFGKGAYPGYAGEVLVDLSSGGSYNAHGANGRKYLLPALFDPSTSSCSTHV